jgi:hypothetical protein
MGRPADDVDGLLREFFQSEMPDPWPALRTPARVTLSFDRPSSWRRRFRSSLALAASLLVLALGLGLLSGKFSDQSSSGIDGKMPTGMHDKDKPHHPDIRPDKK